MTLSRVPSRLPCKAHIAASYVQDLRSSLTDSSLAECKAFIRSFVKQVRVKQQEAEITYTIPLQPGGLLEEKVGVLPVVHSSGPLWTRTTDPGLIRTVL